ncbi:hypothetical protein JHK87_047584 [Glycine soja]|nr:hypothetical protein JHK87_047584 [Glycine soja]
MVPGSGNGNGKDATKNNHHHPQLENVMLLRRATASSARGPPFLLSILNPAQYESENKAIFGALNLNPQLFYNEVLNIVDNVLDKAFNIFYQDASTKLNIEGTQSSHDLKMFISVMVQNLELIYKTSKQSYTTTDDVLAAIDGGKSEGGSVGRH